MNKLKYLTK